MSEKNFFDLISTRHSVRSFKNDSIPDEKITSILDSATKAPSSGNLQSYQIFVVSQDSDKNQLVESAHGQGYISEAPTVLVFCADPKRCSTEYGTRGENLFSIQDATLACAYSQIAAHNLGLSSVWIGSFDEEKVVKILNISGGLKPVAILPIGISNETPEVTPRRPKQEVIQKI